MSSPQQVAPHKDFKDFTFLRSFDAGGSVASTFLVRDSSGQERILKYADWDGIGSNGKPWLESQAKRLVELRSVLPKEAGQWLPQIYNSGYTAEGAFYVLMEYFEDAEPLSEYYFAAQHNTAEAYLADINSIVDYLATYFYALGTTETPPLHVRQAHIDRVNYRLGLFFTERTETFSRFINNKPVYISNKQHNTMSHFFSDIIKRPKIVINGVECVNATYILQRIGRNPHALQQLTPSFLPRHTHGDSLLRNYLKARDGSIKIIDIRGNALPNNATSSISLPFELGKMLHSTWLEIVRSNQYEMRMVPVRDLLTFEIRPLDSKENVIAFLRVRDELPKLFEENALLMDFLKNDPHWLEQSIFAEACHFLSDAVNRLAQEPTGEHSLAYYLIGTLLLNELDIVNTL